MQTSVPGVAAVRVVWPACRYHTDPSGTYVKYSAKAIGSGAEGAQSTLAESWRADLTLAEAEVLALSTLKQVMEEKVRCGWCGGGGGGGSARVRRWR